MSEKPPVASVVAAPAGIGAGAIARRSRRLSIWSVPRKMGAMQALPTDASCTRTATQSRYAAPGVTGNVPELDRRC